MSVSRQPSARGSVPAGKERRTASAMVQIRQEGQMLQELDKPEIRYEIMHDPGVVLYPYTIYSITRYFKDGIEHRHVLDVAMTRKGAHRRIRREKEITTERVD